MEGSVLYYNKEDGKGVVRDSSGTRYNFSSDEWKADTLPKLGMPVDFINEDGRATQIFTLVSLKSTTLKSTNSSEEKFAKMQNSDFASKVSALFSRGIHNKFGMAAAAALLISLFLPIIRIPFIGTVSMVESGVGKFLVVLLAILIAFFYGGATRLYTQIVTGMALVIMCFLYYDLFSGLSYLNNMFGGIGQQSLNSPHVLEMLEWGLAVNAVACVALFLAAYKKEYNINKEAI